MALIPALQRLRQVDFCEVKASLVCLLSFGSTRPPLLTLSKKKKNQIVTKRTGMAIRISAKITSFLKKYVRVFCLPTLCACFHWKRVLITFPKLERQADSVYFKEATVTQ